MSSAVAEQDTHGLEVEEQLDAYVADRLVCTAS